MAYVNEEQLKAQMDKRGIPAYMHAGLLRWILYGIPPGDFLTALLSNDLRRTFEKADDTNVRCIQNYLIFLYNDAPSGCWGSKENFKSWKGTIKRHAVPDEYRGADAD